MTQDAAIRDYATLERILSQAQTAMDPTAPVSILKALLIVAQHEGETMTVLADRMDANRSTASRHLLDLGERNRKMEPGYGLIESRADPVNLRQKRVALTPKGRMLLKSMRDVLNR